MSAPAYAHLPMLVNEQRKKLSKRKDPVSTESYRDQGYLPEAFVNYLALLGWSPRGDEEIVPLSTLIEQFRLEDVSHSPAFFDVKKLRHMKASTCARSALEEFLEASAPWVASVARRLATQRPEPSWTQDQFSPPLRRGGPPRPRARGRRWARSRPWWSSSSWMNCATTRRPSPRSSRTIPRAQAILEGAIARYEGLRVECARPARRRPATRRRTRARPAQGAGAGSLCHHGQSRRTATLRVTRLPRTSDDPGAPAPRAHEVRLICRVIKVAAQTSFSLFSSWSSTSA